jgi:hypothetical protein
MTRVDVLVALAILGLGSLILEILVSVGVLTVQQAFG